MNDVECLCEFVNFFFSVVKVSNCNKHCLIKRSNIFVCVQIYCYEKINH